MNGGQQRKRILTVVGILIAFSLFLFGCAGSSVLNSTGPASHSTSPIKNENLPQYYDFGDVLVPAALKADDKSTYIVQTSGFATGILVLNGRVKRNSLISFFQTNMEKDNWKAISSFKSPRTSTFLLFKKTNRWCVISITERDFNTHVEIGVAPTAYEGESGLFK